MNDSVSAVAAPSTPLDGVTSGADKLHALPQIPDHELIRCIGRGSYGEVWLARNIMGTYRAVKIVYRRTFKDAHPFEREFNGIQKFEPVSRTHEGLVDILQIGRNDRDGYFYYVMELADDGSEIHNPQPEIRDWESYAPKTIRTEISRRGRLPFEDCLQLSLSLTAALSHLHKGGLVHRDIKPSNIIFVNGIPKLADIGLVADTSEAKSYVGTEGFIPPEGPGTPQADIYSLGKVLYEIATGKDRQSFPEPPTLLEEFADRGRFLELNEVIIKACETDLRARYRSAEEMHDDLVLLQTGRSVRRLRVIERRFRIAKRVGAIAAAVALLVMGILYQTTKEKARATERVIRLYVANGSRLMNEGDLFGSLLWFTQALRLDAGDAAREEPHRTRIASVLRQCPKLLNVFAHGTSLFYAEFSPDGTRLVTASDDYTARVWDVDSGKEILVLRHDGPVYHAAFSPDGRCIVTASADHTARVWDAQSGEPVSPPLRHKDTVWGAGFSPDSQTVATASADKTAQVWNFTTGEPIGPPLVHPNSVARVSFSPDGQLLAAVTVGDCAWIWETKAGRLRPFSPLKHMGTFCGVQFSRTVSGF